MLNKIVLTVILIAVFLTFGGALLASNCKSAKSETLPNYDISKNSRLKVIPNFENLDNESIEMEIKNVGKYYSDIKIGEMHNKCNPMLFFNIYDDKVILSNGKYIYQFKYDVFLSPFNDNQLDEESSVNYIVFQKKKAVSMYFEFTQKNGYWEIVSEGKYFSL